MQNVAILRTCRIVREVLAAQRIRSAWSVDRYCLENGLNWCDVREVDDDDEKIIKIIKRVKVKVK